MICCPACGHALTNPNLLINPKKRLIAWKNVQVKIPPLRNGIVPAIDPGVSQWRLS